MYQCAFNLYPFLLYLFAIILCNMHHFQNWVRVKASYYANHLQVFGLQLPAKPFYTPVFRRDVLWYGDVRPSVRPSVRHSFPHFSPTCFDILIWNFVYHFIVMHVRSSSNAVNFGHVLQELCSFLTSNSYKYGVFRTFLLHALTYWVQIVYMTLFTFTTEQVWVSSFCFNFCWSYASLWT